MSETGFVELYHMVSGVEILLYAASITAFLHPLLQENAGRKSLFVYLAYVCIFFLGLVFPIPGLLCMLLVTALLMTCHGFLGVAPGLLFLLCMLFFCIRDLSFMVVQSLDYFSVQMFLRDADTPEKIFLMAALNHILIETLALLLFFLMLWRLALQFQKKALTLQVKELCYLLLTPFAGILFVHMILRLLIVADGDSIFQLYEQVPAAIYIIPLLAMLFYVGTLVAIGSCQKVIALQEERSQSFIEQQQLTGLQERLTQVEQFYAGIRQMKHEMRGHLTNIKGLAENGHYEDIDHYIAKMDSSLKSLEFSISTGNAVTDVIVNDKHRTSVSLGIDFQADFAYPPASGYDAYDIGIILNNLLQNALEACKKVEQKKRYLYLSSRKRNHFYLIEVRNSFDGNVRFDGHTGLPVSTKGPHPIPGFGPSMALHGIGLSNVRREAKKYRGNVDIQVRGREFQVTVLLQENSN